MINSRILDSSKLKEFADDNFKFKKKKKNSRKFSKPVGNTVGKGEIVRYKQFLLFSNSVCKRLALQTRKNQGLFENELTKESCTFISYVTLTYNSLNSGVVITRVSVLGRMVWTFRAHTRFAGNSVFNSWVTIETIQTPEA